MFHSYMNVSQQETENGLDNTEATTALAASSSHPCNDQVQTSTSAPPFSIAHPESPILHERSLVNQRTDSIPILSQSGSSILHPSNTSHIRTQPVPTSIPNLNHNIHRPRNNSLGNTLTHNPIDMHPIPLQHENSFHAYHQPPQQHQRSQDNTQIYNQRSLPQPFTSGILSPYDQPNTLQRHNSHPTSTEIPMRVASPVHPTPQPSTSRTRLPFPSDPLIYNSNLSSSTLPLSNQLPIPVIPDTVHTGSSMIPRFAPSIVRRNNLQPHRSPTKRRKRSYVWKFFTEAPESSIHGSTAFCTLCHGKVPRGKHNQKNTTNLIKHLQHRHPEVAAEASRMNGKDKEKSVYGVLSGSSSPPKTHSDLHSNGYPDTTRTNNQYLSRSLGQGVSSYNNNNNRDGSMNAQANGRGRLTNEMANGIGPAFHQDVAERPIRPSHSAEDGLLIPGTPLRNTASSNIPSLTATGTQGMSTSHHHGNTNNQGLELENGRPVEYASWAHRVSYSKRGVAVRGNECDEMVTNEDSGMDFSELNSAIVEFLALMDLPLSASKSRALDALLRMVQTRPYLNLSRYRNSSFTEPVKAMQNKIRSMLSDTDKLFLTVSKKGCNRLIICQYYDQNFGVQYVCLDVLRPSDLLPSKTTGNDVHLTEASSGMNDGFISALLDRIAQNLDYWDIRNKVSAVIISENGISSERLYLPDHSSSEESIPSLFRDVSDSSSKSSKRQIYNRDGEIGFSHDGTTRLSKNCRQIPVLPCMIGLLEGIAERTICNNEEFERVLISPIIRGIFKALTDYKFKNSSVFDKWRKGLEVSMFKPSMKDLLEIIRYYHSNMEMVRNAVSRCRDPTDLEILYVEPQDVYSLQNVLEAFEKAVNMFTPNCKGQNLSNRGRASMVLPLMWELLNDLEQVGDRSSDTFKPLIQSVIDVVKMESRRLESQDLYTCATTLDPRFKSNYFVTKHVREVVRNNILSYCDEEVRRSDQCRMVSNNGTMDFFETLIPSDKNATYAAFNTYENQPTCEKMQDIDEYWKERKSQWPILSKVAAKFILLPCISQSGIIFGKDDDMKNKENGEELMMEFMRCNLINSEKTGSLLGMVQY